MRQIRRSGKTTRMVNAMVEEFFLGNPVHIPLHASQVKPKISFVDPDSPWHDSGKFATVQRELMRRFTQRLKTEHFVDEPAKYFGKHHLTWGATFKWIENTVN